MNIIAINGSPRTHHNTGTLLEKAAEGAMSKGATVETINLYKLNYKGCTACFSCKRKGSKSLYNCAVKDDLTSVLEKIKNADGIIFSSPIYFSDITGEMRSFLERLLFAYLPYDPRVKEGTYFPRAVKTAFIYTMGIPVSPLEEKLKSMEDFISMIFRSPIKTYHSKENYPFLDDCTNYEVSVSAMEGLAKQKEETLPIDYEAAFKLGAGLVDEK